MSHLRISLPLLFLAAACATTATLPPGQRLGEPIEARAILPLATVQANPEQHFNQTLLVEAKVVAVCQSMGCWMQVEDGGHKSLVRWESGCGGKYSFPKDAVGERILIQGSFYPKEIKAQDIEHLQEEAGGKVQVAERGYEFNASAVVLLDRQG